MKQSFEKILDELPLTLSRSRLEPYRDLIHELRARRYSYREVARVLADKCNLRVCHSSIHDFVRVHMLESATADLAASESPVPPPAESAKNLGGSYTCCAVRGDGEIRQLIAVLKSKPPAADDATQQFRFDASEPLRLKPEK